MDVIVDVYFTIMSLISDPLHVFSTITQLSEGFCTSFVKKKD